MKLYNIDDENKKDWLKITDYENWLNINIDKKNNYVYNLNSTLILNIPSSIIKIYTCKSDLHWPIISYNIYNTTRLVWVLLKINEILPDEIFKPILAGDSIFYIDSEYIDSIAETINGEFEET